MSTLKVNSIESSSGSEVDINSSLGSIPSVNVSGTLTATNAVITGDLTVQGTTTTLDTNLVEVDRVEVGANSTNPGIAVTQSGSGPAAYFNGDVGIGTDNPSAILDVVSNDASAYIAEFRQTNTSNTGQIIIDSPTDGASRPSYMDYATGGSVKWRTGLGYLDTARSFHIGTGSLPSNSKLTIKTDGKTGVGTDNPVDELHINSSSANVNLRLTRDTNTGARISGTDSTNPAFIVETIASGTATERMRIDSSGRLLIGDSSANATFGSGIEVSGTGARSNCLLSRYQDGANSPKLYFAKSRSGTIGTNTIVQQNDELGTIDFRGANGSGWDAGAQIRCFVDGTPGASNDMPGRLVFTTTPNGSNTPNERMRIDSDGHLLIGTTSSTNVREDQKLAVVSTGTNKNGGAAFLSYAGTSSDFGSFLDLSRSRGTTDGSFTAVASGDTLGWLIFRGTDGSKFVNSSYIKGVVDDTPGTDDMPGRIEFYTAADGSAVPAERMRIGSNGFTKFSNTGTYNSTTGTYHEFVTTLTNSNNTLFRAPASYANDNIKSFVLTAPGTGYNHFLADSNGTTVCVIRGNGNLANTNNSYGSLSDIKLKENIVDATSQWDDLKAIQVRKYNFKEDTGHETHTQLGVVAQEVELVSPGLVSESPDTDEEGNDLGTVTKSVNYSVLYMKAVKALQEAMERIETLEAKVAALEAD